jgi:hypothetical protein
MKYYYIVYLYEKNGSKMTYNTMEKTKKHPLDLQVEWCQKYEALYIFLDWKEVTKEEYERLEGWMG